MAHIVPFRTAAAREAEEAEAGRAERPQGAQIVIFPGVRRERHAEPDAGPHAEVLTGSPGNAKDPTRDWLELPDAPPSAIL